MACWPANIVGAFFIAVLVLDSMRGDYDELLGHSLAGIITTLIFWSICMGLGESISGAILVVPAVFVIAFAFSLWFFGESMKHRGYCMRSGCAPKPKPTCAPLKPTCPPPKPKVEPEKPKCEPEKPKCQPTFICPHTPRCSSQAVCRSKTQEEMPHIPECHPDKSKCEFAKAKDQA